MALNSRFAPDNPLMVYSIVLTVARYLLLAHFSSSASIWSDRDVVRSNTIHLNDISRVHPQTATKLIQHMIFRTTNRGIALLQPNTERARSEKRMAACCIRSRTVFPLAHEQPKCPARRRILIIDVTNACACLSLNRQYCTRTTSSICHPNTRVISLRNGKSEREPALDCLLNTRFQLISR
jgi:hypothetical protein